MMIQDEQSKFEIEASYEYIGLKLLYIINLFIQGEKFPTGKLSSKVYPVFLSQSIEFMLSEEESVELLKLNSRSYFEVLTKLYLNQYVAETFIQCCQPDQRGNKLIEYDHFEIIEKLHEIISEIGSEKYVKFEFSYFIIKISESKYCIEISQELVSDVFKSIETVMQEIIKSEKSYASINYEDEDSYNFVGPKSIDMKTIEPEIKKILPYYSKHIEHDNLEILIELCDKLNFNHIKIYLYEWLNEFDKWIDIYLKSKEWKSEEVFRWLHELYKIRQTKKESKIENLKEKILDVIENLVVIDAQKTGYVIDEWLPEKQFEVIEKLRKDPKSQLKYLESYLEEREDDIKDTQMASARNFSINSNIKDYKGLLELHVTLLANNNDPNLIDVVCKEYYPVNWLDKYKQNSSLLVKEAQAHLK